MKANVITNLPPGMSSQATHLTGRTTCAECGANLPEHASCPLCAKPMDWDAHKGEWVCPDRTLCLVYCPGDVCLGGCAMPEYENC